MSDPAAICEQEGCNRWAVPGRWGHGNLCSIHEPSSDLCCARPLAVGERCDACGRVRVQFQDRPLVDDLADVLSHVVVGWEERLGVDLAQHPEVVRVMYRYRRSKSYPPESADG